MVSIPPFYCLIYTNMHVVSMFLFVPFVKLLWSISFITWHLLEISSLQDLDGRPIRVSPAEDRR